MSSLDCVFALDVASPFLMLIGLFGMGNATPHIVRWSLSQAKVNAMRYEIDEEQANKAIKAISKDVPRPLPRRSFDHIYHGHHNL